MIITSNPSKFHFEKSSPNLAKLPRPKRRNNSSRIDVIILHFDSIPLLFVTPFPVDRNCSDQIIHPHTHTRAHPGHTAYPPIHKRTSVKRVKDKEITFGGIHGFRWFDRISIERRSPLIFRLERIIRGSPYPRTNNGYRLINC